jgi:uncharacterized protein YggL (DUF469 family)
LNLGAITSERFIDSVIDDLINQVVEAAFAGGADIHTWALADRFEALEDGDRRGVVAWLLFRHLASDGIFKGG